MKHFTIKEKDNGQRLDIWLAEALKLSRSAVQKLIKQGTVLLDGKTITAHRLLKTGEEISVSAEKKETKKIGKKLSLPEIPIIAETDEYLVIDKPAGVLMHGSEADERETLVDWLVERYPSISKVGEDPARPGIVHRLDKDVSGLVVIAKTQRCFDSLKEQFQSRTIVKRYLALVYGADMPDEGEIRFRLERSAKGYRMAAKPLNQPGKIAITEFTVDKRFHNYALVSLAIKTGRTHQIRAHLAAYNHPIVGDDLYGGARNKILNKRFKLGRVFLVAMHLEFNDLAGERQKFLVTLPDILEKTLAKLK